MKGVAGEQTEEFWQNQPSYMVGPVNYIQSYLCVTHIQLPWCPQLTEWSLACF
jgi:hypothetical protein